MADNPSIVNDESGNNFGGITGGSMGQAQMQYLENLQALSQKMPPKPIAQNQYQPGGGDVQIGSYSGSIVGNNPIFAPSNIIPFGMMDAIKRSKAEQEAEYFKGFKTYLDKPISDIKAKLSNPWAQPEFNNKLQSSIDGWLDAYANKFGGNYMKAYVALQNDKSFNKMMTGYAQYADIYNSVFKDATETLVKAKEPDKYYVSEDQVSAINKFLHGHDKMEDLSIDQLGKYAEEFAAKQSVFKLAEAATAGIQQDALSYFERNPTMSNEEQDAYIKTTTTGTKNQAEELYKNVVESQPWLKTDKVQADLLKKEIDNRVKYSVEKTLQQVQKANAQRDLELKKYGVDVQPNGSINFKEIPSSLVGDLGKNGMSYPVDFKKPVPTSAGMQVWIRDGKNGAIKRVTLPDSYQMIPTSEYDLQNNQYVGAGNHRVIEGTINFQSVESYTPDGVRVTTKGGQFTDATDLGPGRGTTQIKPVQAVDDSGNIVELMGSTTVITNFESMKAQIESNIPNTLFVHQKLDEMNYPNPNKPDFGSRRATEKIDKEEASTQGHTGPVKGSKEDPIKADGAEIDVDTVKNDSNVYYKWSNGVIESGADIHKRIVEDKK